MSKAEEFIQENTRNCSQLHYNSACTLRHCITPDQAKEAVEIAREEVVEKVCSFIADNIGEYIELKHANLTTFIEIDGDRFANDLKQAMKDET